MTRWTFVGKVMFLDKSKDSNGNPLQCSCLENLRDGEAWWAAVYGVAQSRTRLKQLSSSSGSKDSLEVDLLYFLAPEILSPFPKPVLAKASLKLCHHPLWCQKI